MFGRSKSEATSQQHQLQQRFESARLAIVGRRLQEMSSQRLGGILERLDEESEQEVVQLERLREQSEAALEQHDWTRFDGLRARAIDVAARYESLRELRRKISNVRHERQLSEKIEARFGSRRAVVAYDWFIMALIVVVVSILVVQELVPMSPRAHVIVDIIDVGACLVFLFDFFWRMRLAESRRWFWRRYWLDFVTSIPIPTSLLRAGRIVRLARLARMVRLVRLFRLIRVLLFFWRGMDKLAATMDVRMMRRSLALLITVLVLGGLGIWYVEGGSSAEGVEDVGQGLWWSFTTVVTGGFGDIRNPTTWTGRFLTIGLIIAGMVVVGIFTATLTSVLVREEDTTAAVLALEESMLAEIGKLREQVTGLAGATGGSAPEAPTETQT